MTIEAKEVVSIVGSSGAGKSTLLQILGTLEKPDQGEVVAVGNGKILEDGNTKPVDVKVGEKILFGKYSGQTVKVDGDELLVLREDDIMAVIEK